MFGNDRKNKNCVLEEINIKLNSGNPCYNSVKNILLYRLPSKNVKIKINKTVILPVVLYGSFTLREKHRLRAFKNKELRIFGLKKDEIMRGRRKLRNDELHNSYSSPCTIRKIKARKMRWAGYVAKWRIEQGIRCFGGKTRKKKSSRKASACKIKMDLT
jgi:hypothetical protein